MAEKAASRREISPAGTSLYMIIQAAVFFEVHRIPKRGITSKEIAEKYSLGEVWYEYENSTRRVNMVEQLIRNQLNKYYKERQLVKMWNSRNGRLIHRKNYVVYFKPDLFPDKQIEYHIGIPDRYKWGLAR